LERTHSASCTGGTIVRAHSCRARTEKGHFPLCSPVPWVDSRDGLFRGRLRAVGGPVGGKASICPEHETEEKLEACRSPFTAAAALNIAPNYNDIRVFRIALLYVSETGLPVWHQTAARGIFIHLNACTGKCLDAFIHLTMSPPVVSWRHLAVCCHPTGATMRSRSIATDLENRQFSPATLGIRSLFSSLNAHKLASVLSTLAKTCAETTLFFSLSRSSFYSTWLLSYNSNFSRYWQTTAV